MCARPCLQQEERFHIDLLAVENLPFLGQRIGLDPHAVLQIAEAFVAQVAAQPFAPGVLSSGFLELLRRQGVINTWHDRQILGGEDWAGVIDDNFKRAALILLLVSADFLASDYCDQTEMRMALEREAKGQAGVVPAILRACDWKGAPFGKLQGFPKDMKPVTSWPNRDEA